MSFALKGVAYITGAGSGNFHQNNQSHRIPHLHLTFTPGIGQSAAYALARQGVRQFALLDRNSSKTTINELKKNYPDIQIRDFELDVINEKAVNESVAETVKTFGRLDYAFNNAGIGGSSRSTENIEIDEFERVLSVNMMGVWLCQRAQIRQMLKQEKLSDSVRAYRGSIVNMASMFGVVGPSLNVPATAYAASKHAIVGLTKADAVAMVHRGIKINTISPG
jgi:NAD(P)-dependent dehydrogenase (short-subunit alcohol dehydrogenase family)